MWFCNLLPVFNGILKMVFCHLKLITNRALSYVYPPFQSIEDEFAPIVVDESTIPSASNMVFPSWSRTCRLPTPEAVRSHHVYLKEGWRANVVHFEELELVVKFGKEIYMGEAYAMWFVAQYAPSVSLPTLYGWAQQDGEVFIYYEYIKGETMETRWPSLKPEQKIGLSNQLRGMVGNLRRFRHIDSSHQYIGRLAIHDRPQSPINGPS